MLSGPQPCGVYELNLDSHDVMGTGKKHGVLSFWCGMCTFRRKPVAMDESCMVDGISAAYFQL